MKDWRMMYDEEHMADLNREDDGTPIEDLGRFEIVFDVGDERYYCFIDAINMHEALGQFFSKHENITYLNIIDHMEV